MKPASELFTSFCSQRRRQTPGIPGWTNITDYATSALVKVTNRCLHAIRNKSLTSLMVEIKWIVSKQTMQIGFRRFAIRHLRQHTE